MSRIERRRWGALIVLNLGSVMIIIDSMIVNVALASIKADLRFSDTGLAWVVNAYMIAFAGLMLLAGRLGDAFGHRRLFLGGLVLFTLASFSCGLAESQGVLLTARAIQGMGGACVSAAAFALTMKLFTDTAGRADALGMFGIVSACGGSFGLMLGGILTGTFNWHWIFWINLPAGVSLFAVGSFLLPSSGKSNFRAYADLDLLGATVITAALMLANYAVLNQDRTGMLAQHAIAQICFALLLLLFFFAIEVRAPSPLMPLRLFRQRNLTTATVALMLLCTAGAAWNFMSSMYLRLVLHSTPMNTALAFLPANLISLVFSWSLSKLVIRIGIKLSLTIGLILEILGLMLLAHAPVSGSISIDVLPAIALLGLAGNLAFVPLLLAAMGDVEPSDSGIASGVVNTTFTMGQTFGLAVLVRLANARTMDLLADGNSVPASLTGGYHLAYLASAILCTVAVGCGSLLKTSSRETASVSSPTMSVDQPSS